jgi:hypothetical protein
MPGTTRTVTMPDDYETWLIGRIRGTLRRAREEAVKDRFDVAAELAVKRKVLIEALDEYRRFRSGEGSDR